MRFLKNSVGVEGGFSINLRLASIVDLFGYNPPIPPHRAPTQVRTALLYFKNQI